MVPGAADRIIRMAEVESAHRQNLENIEAAHRQNLEQQALLGICAKLVWDKFWVLDRIFATGFGALTMPL
ncbi:MAG: DUF2335 domain-containing protein [Candidatus Competibacteraceae bacterium]